MASWLLVRDRAVVARSWAAALLDLEGAPRSAEPQFVVVRGALDRVGGLRLHTTRTLDAIDLVTVRRTVPAAVRRDPLLGRARPVTSYRVTSASRSIIDLAPSLDEDSIAALVDSACRLGHSSPVFLARRLTDLRGHGRAGTPVVENALVDAGGHSTLERSFLTVCRKAGLPRPHCQATYRADGKILARVDFDFAPIPLVVEVNGRRGHSSDADRIKDARRRNALQARGITVLEYAYRHVLGEADTVVADIAALLENRRPT